MTKTQDTPNLRIPAYIIAAGLSVGTAVALTVSSAWAYIISVAYFVVLFGGAVALLLPKSQAVKDAANTIAARSMLVCLGFYFAYGILLNIVQPARASLNPLGLFFLMFFLIPLYFIGSYVFAVLYARAKRPE